MVSIFGGSPVLCLFSRFVVFPAHGIRTRRDLHFPALILAKIVSFVAQDGIKHLRNWLVAGRAGRVAVHSPETLALVRLDRHSDFVKWARPDSVYHDFFGMCLYEKNPYALYVKSLFLAFQCSALKEAIAVVSTIKHVYPVAELLWIMLKSCEGTMDMDFYWNYKKKSRFGDVDLLADSLMYHITKMRPKRRGTFSKAWQFEEALQEFNGERCIDCIFFYLSRDVMLLS
ncbi:PREDICTED: uncharacterized protein LOC104772163 [Camelina sativa]|uniref:Uncharacterized protein LOC104772163 n=1 Tax=Camelina sativa TaxID=90675 RepID=A0ABM0Y416_CAMSA|nr:PREDICTED: uncharacterized protein LOC104772163 [Camelina sativa]